VPADAFVPLETALLEAQAWAPITALSTGLTAALATELPEIFLGSVGIRPLRDVASVAALEKPALPSPENVAAPRRLGPAAGAPEGSAASPPQLPEDGG
jgi:hypothetical protein